MYHSRSERIIQALQQLPQFLPHNPEGDAIYAAHVLTGVRVFPVPDSEEEDHGLILLSFSRENELEVAGDLYLALQASEAAAHYLHSPGDGNGPIAKRAGELLEHLHGKYGLD